MSYSGHCAGGVVGSSDLLGIEKIPAASGLETEFEACFQLDFRLQSPKILVSKRVKAVSRDPRPRSSIAALSWRTLPPASHPRLALFESERRLGGLGALRRS